MVFGLDPQNATSLLSLPHPLPPPTCGLWVLLLMASNLWGSHSLLGRSSRAINTLKWKQRYKMKNSLKAWWAEGQQGKRGRGQGGLEKEDKELQQSTSEAQAPPLLVSYSFGQPVPCTSQQQFFPPCSWATHSELDSFWHSFFFHFVFIKMLKEKSHL